MDTHIDQCLECGSLQSHCLCDHSNPSSFKIQLKILGEKLKTDITHIYNKYFTSCLKSKVTEVDLLEPLNPILNSSYERQLNEIDFSHDIYR